MLIPGGGCSHLGCKGHKLGIQLPGYELDGPLQAGEAVPQRLCKPWRALPQDSGQAFCGGGLASPSHQV